MVNLLQPDKLLTALEEKAERLDKQNQREIQSLKEKLQDQERRSKMLHSRVGYLWVFLFLFCFAYISSIMITSVMS